MGLELLRFMKRLHHSRWVFTPYTWCLGTERFVCCIRGPFAELADRKSRLIDSMSLVR